MTDLTKLTIEEASQALDAGDFDAVDLYEAYRARIERLEPSLNCFITLTIDAARNLAEASSARATEGRRLGPLDGIPIALKDNIDVAGVPTTNGFGWAAAITPEEDAAVVGKLKAAGAVLLGKLNMHEGALGATTDNPHHGRTQNPWRPGYTPGGSSGGSGAAVAARLCAAALGTDTMGSVRLPAAYCGVVGLKPSNKLVPQRGLHLLAEDHDVIGPLARTVRDAALVLSAMIGEAKLDSVVAPVPIDKWLTVTPLPDSKTFTIGLVENFDEVDVLPEVDRIFNSTLAQCRELGADDRKFKISKFQPTKARLAGLVTSEAEGWKRHNDAMQRHSNAYSIEFRGFLEYGGDAGAERIRKSVNYWRAVGAKFSQELFGVDVIASPTAPQPAFPFGDPAPANQADFTAPANFAGAPAISIPAGLSEEGLPVGFQLMAQAGQEAKLLAVAALIEADLLPITIPEPKLSDR